MPGTDVPRQSPHERIDMSRVVLMPHGDLALEELDSSTLRGLLPRADVGCTIRT
jgi:hypothetical protein